MNLEYLEKLYFKAIKSENKESDIESADRYINIAYKEVFLDHYWIYRKRSGQLNIIPRYTTGTCVVTKFNGTNESAARTVTFTGASLSENWRGRYLRVKESSVWHKINYLTGSGTSWTVYLDSPIVDVDSGSKTFEIWKRFYYVKSDVAEILDFGRFANGRLEYNPDLLDRYTDLSKESDTPSSFNAYGVDPFDDIELTGTISIPAGSNVGTGSNTTWLSDGYDTGDVIQISNIDYYIKRVETDTRIILFNYFESEIVSGTSFTLRKKDSIGFEFYNPADTYHILPYDYLGRAYDLVHRTKDRILLPNNFIPAIISRAQYFAMKDNNDNRYTDILKIYLSERNGLREKVQVVKPRYMQFTPKISRLSPGRG